jgi:hypothetical protein
VFFGLGTPGSAPTPVPEAPPRSLLPATQPGLSANEGVFLVTTTDDGSDAIYFIAQNTRHSTLPGDLQLERQLNPLWPVWAVDRDVVLAFLEAAPVGAARVGLLSATVSDGEPAAADAPIATDAESAAADAPIATDAESATADAPVVADAEPAAADAPVVADAEPAAADAPIAG